MMRDRYRVDSASERAPWLSWPWYDLSPRWEYFEAIGREWDARKRNNPRARLWNGQSNVIGLQGEATVGLHIGAEPNVTYREDGYPFPDFPGIEVKATPYWRGRGPHLLVPPSGPWTAPTFVLVALDCAAREGAVVGYATREEVRAAPLRTLGNMREAAHALRWSDLHPFPRTGRTA